MVIGHMARSAGILSVPLVVAAIIFFIFSEMGAVADVQLTPPFFGISHDDHRGFRPGVKVFKLACGLGFTECTVAAFLPLHGAAAVWSDRLHGVTFHIGRDDRRCLLAVPPSPNFSPCTTSLFPGGALS